MAANLSIHRTTLYQLYCFGLIQLCARSLCQEIWQFCCFSILTERFQSNFCKLQGGCMRFSRVSNISLLIAALMVIGSSPARAASILVLTDTSGGAVSCDNSLPIGPGNCGAGFTTVANSNFISFTGVVGGFSILAANIGGNQPGSPIAGNVLSSTFSVLHASGTGNLMIDYGGNNFSLPAG